MRKERNQISPNCASRAHQAADNGTHFAKRSQHYKLPSICQFLALCKRSVVSVIKAELCWPSTPSTRESQDATPYPGASHEARADPLSFLFAAGSFIQLALSAAVAALELAVGGSAQELDVSVLTCAGRRGRRSHWRSAVHRRQPGRTSHSPT